MLLHEGNIQRVLRCLEQQGLFRLDILVHRNVQEGIYLPYYLHTSSVWKRVWTVTALVLHIPHVTYSVIKEDWERKKSTKTGRAK